MKTIVKYTIKEFLKTSSFLLFTIIPPIFFIVITIINSTHLNGPNQAFSWFYNRSMLIFLIMYIASITLSGMCMHLFNKKINKELKNIALATTSFQKYIFAVSFSYYLLYLIPFLAINITLIAFKLIAITTLITYFLIGVITFFMFSCISFFISSTIKESKTIVAITLISFWVIIALLLVPQYSNNIIALIFVRIFPGSSILMFFYNTFFNTNQPHFDVLAFIFTIIYLIVFLYLTIKYYSWI